MDRYKLMRVALVVALSWGLGCGDDASRLEEHRSQGVQYLEDEQHAEAIIEFRNALRIDPNDVTAHYGLARAFLAVGNPAARWELEETVRLDPEHEEARMLLINLTLLGGTHARARGSRADDLFEQILGHTDALLAQQPEHEGAFLARGRALVALDRPDEALEALEQALAYAEDPGEALLTLANFHRARGDREAAEELLRRFVEEKGSFAAYRALGSLLATDRERDAETEVLYVKAVEVAEGKQITTGVQTLAAFYFGRERFDDAEAAVLSGIERTENDLELVLALARFYDVRGQPERADEVIEEVTRTRPDEVQPHLILSAYRGHRGDREGALEAAEAALAVEPNHKNARLRKAELLVDIGYRSGDRTHTAQGQAIVDAILAAEPGDAQALFVRGKIEMAEGRHGDAIVSLRTVLDTRADWAQAHFLLGSALFASGERAAAKESLTRALEIDASLMAARRTLLEVRSALAEYDLMVEEGRRILAVRPQDRRVRVLVAQALVRRRDPEGALAELEQVPEDQRNAQVEYAVGRIYRLQGDAERARLHFERALLHDSTQSDVLAALLELDAREERLAESLARINAAVDARPDSSTLLQLRGLAEARAGQREAAEASLRSAVDLDPNNLNAYQRLAQFLAQSGRQEEVVRTYEQALAAQPGSASLNLIVGILHEGLGRPESALERYEAAIRLNPDLGVAKNNLAYLLAERGKDLDRALDLAQEAKALLPDNASAADTLGWVLYKKNIPSAAIGYLKEAEAGFPSEDPSLGIVRQHLALAYEANGEIDEARVVVDRALVALAEQGAAFEERTGQEAPEPAWAGELRALRDRLDAAPDA